MSKYTTEVRFIVENACGLTESKGYNDVNQLIDTACPLIFNFDYPIFDEDYRLILERKILKHYYTREIGLETVGLWKLHLDRKLNEIMPYYNKLYESETIKINPLHTYDVTRQTTRKTDGTSNNNSATSNTGSYQGTDSNVNNSTNINKYSDTPQGALNGIINDNYLTNATQDTSNGSSVNTTENNTKNNSYSNNATVINNIEDFIENVSGHMVTSESKLIKEYRESFINIDMMIIDELADLFMNLW